jgi:hypothetical protein
MQPLTEVLKTHWHGIIFPPKNYFIIISDEQLYFSSVILTHANVFEVVGLGGPHISPDGMLLYW